MTDLALQALDAAVRRGASYADVRVEHRRGRSLATKNARIGHSSSIESMGAGIRVICQGAWGFAATSDLSAAGLESAAGLAVEIARASASARRDPLVLAPEEAHRTIWVSPSSIDPFGVPVERQLT